MSLITCQRCAILTSQVNKSRGSLQNLHRGIFVAACGDEKGLGERTSSDHKMKCNGPPVPQERSFQSQLFAFSGHCHLGYQLFLLFNNLSDHPKSELQACHIIPSSIYFPPLIP